MLSKVITLCTLLASALLAGIITSVPLSTSSVGTILAVFFLLYIILVGVMAGGGYALGWAAARISKSLAFRRPIHAISLQHSYYLSSVLAFGPIMLLGMNTVSKVTIYDVLLIALFLAIGVFYVQKRAG